MRTRPSRALRLTFPCDDSTAHAILVNPHPPSLCPASQRDFLANEEFCAKHKIAPGIEGKSVIVQGFGNVGFYAAKFFEQHGECGGNRRASWLAGRQWARVSAG